MRPKAGLFFNIEGKNKDTNPNLLDATVGGHVEIDSDYENSALQELKEETGVKATKDNFVFIQFMRSKTYDEATDTINNVIRAIYAYCYDCDIEDLKTEKEKAIGFEAWSFDKIFNITNEDRKRFIPTIFENEVLNIFRKIQKL